MSLLLPRIPSPRLLVGCVRVMSVVGGCVARRRVVVPYHAGMSNQRKPKPKSPTPPPASTVTRKPAPVAPDAPRVDLASVGAKALDSTGKPILPDDAPVEALPAEPAPPEPVPVVMVGPHPAPWVKEVRTGARSITLIAEDGCDEQATTAASAPSVTIDGRVYDQIACGSGTKSTKTLPATVTYILRERVV